MKEEIKFTRNNRGIFHLSSNFLKDDQLSTTLQIFKALQFIPIKVEFLWNADRLECSGLSPIFRDSPLQEATPVYDVVVHITKDAESNEDIFTVEVKESSFNYG